MPTHRAHRLLTCLPGLWLGLAAACSAVADTSDVVADASRDFGRGVTFVLENDLFFDTDRYYTNGVSVAFASRPWLIPPETWDKLAQRVSLGRTINRTNVQAAFGVELAQLMATPRDISLTTPQLGDRPWAGL